MSKRTVDNVIEDMIKIRLQWAYDRGHYQHCEYLEVWDGLKSELHEMVLGCVPKKQFCCCEDEHPFKPCPECEAVTINRNGFIKNINKLFDVKEGER